METAAIETQVVKLLTDRVGIPPDAAVPGARLVDDLGLDSLDAVELVIALEQQFGIDVSDAEVARLETVGDLVTLVVERASGHAP